jgi:hypothetical protein
MAEPRTEEEIYAEQRRVHGMLEAEEITVSEYYDRLNALDAESARIRKAALQEQIDAGLTQEEIYGPPEVPPVTGWRPESDPVKAKAEAMRALRSWEQGDQYDVPVRERTFEPPPLTEDMTGWEMINRAITPATMNYGRVPDIGVSNIVDLEKGLVRNPRTGEIYRGSQGELFLEAMQRQTLATTEEWDRMMAQRQEMQERERERRQQEAWEAAGEGEFLDAGVGAMENIAAEAKSIGEDVMIGALTEPAARGGLVVESFLGTVLRDLVTVPTAGLTAVVDPLMPVSETEDYIRSDIKRAMPYERTVDQFILNLGKGQGLPQLFESTPALVDGMDQWFLPYFEPETYAFVLGMVSEFGVPATPYGVVKGAGKLGRSAGFSPPDPVEWVKTQVVVDRLDQATEAFGTRPVKDIAREFADTPKTPGDMLMKEAKRAGLTDVVSSTLAEKISDTVMLRAAIDSGDVAVSDLGGAVHRQAVKGLLAEIEERTGSVPTHLTRANSGASLTREIDGFKAAASANEDWAAWYNLAQGQADLLKSGRRFDPTTVSVEDAPASRFPAAPEREPTALPYEPGTAIERAMPVPYREQGIVDVFEGAPGPPSVRGDLPTTMRRGRGTEVLKKPPEKGDPATVKVVEVGERDAPRLNTSTMGIEFQNELARQRFARGIADGSMARGDMGRFFTEANKMEGRVQQDAMTRVILDRRFGLDTTTGTLADILPAAGNVLKRSIRDTVRNLMPENLYVLAGDVVISAEAFEKGAAWKAYAKDLTAANKMMKQSEDGTWRVAKGFRDGLLDDVMEYVGVETIRQSKSYRELVHQLSTRGSFDPRFRKTVDESIVNALASEHLGATRLVTGGEQFQRAMKPMDLRGEMLALSEADRTGSFGNVMSEQWSKGELARLGSDIAKGWGTAWNRVRGVGFRPQAGVRPAAEFASLQKHMESVTDTLQSRVVDEWEALSKKHGPVAGLDIMSADTWGSIRGDIAGRIDREVKRGYSGYTEWINTMLKPEHRNQISRSLNLESLGGLAKDVAAAATEEAVKELVIDYALYFPKKDAWRRLLHTYYGTEVGEELLENMMRDLVHVKSTAGRRMLAGEFVDFRPRASTMLDVNLSNFRTVIDRAEGAFDDLVGLKSTVLRREQKVMPVQEWILGVRQGDEVSSALADFIDRNPRYRLELLPDYYSTGMEINLRPLARRYDEIFSEAANSLGMGAAGMADRGARLASKHFEVVSRINATDRADVLVQFTKLINEQRTTRPSLASMRMNFERLLEIPKRSMDRAVADEARSLFGSGPEVDKAVRRMQAEVWEMFFNARPLDGRYHADPVMSVAQDILENMREFYRVNGLAVASQLPETLSANLPLFKRVPGTDQMMVYGRGEMAVVRKLEALAKTNKLQTTLERMDPRARLHVVERVLAVVDNVRMATVQGMLAGVWVPGVRYLAQNAMIMPIMLASVGPARALKAHGMIPKALIARKAADDAVLVTSRTGREYTAKELRGLESRYNIGMTRGQAELYHAEAKSAYRRVGITGSGEEMGGLERLLNYVDPTQRNAFTLAADEMDMTVRRAALYSALADDMPVDQALKLAKRSILDYGAMSTTERNYINKFMWFWSFRRNMTAETVNALSRSVLAGDGASAASYMMRVWRLQMRQQQYMDSWALGDDRQKARMYSIWKKKVDGLDAHTYGLANPSLEAFQGLVNLVGMGASTVWGEVGMTEALVTLIRSGNWSPLINFVTDQVAEYERTSIPDQYVNLAKALGVWDEFREFFGVETRPEAQRRQQSPVYGTRQQQYRFKKGRGIDFARWNLALMGAGMERGIKDVTTGLMAGGFFGDEADNKRLGLPTWWTYWLNLETSLKSHDIRTVQMKNLQLTEKQYKDLSK